MRRERVRLVDEVGEERFNPFGARALIETRKEKAMAEKKYTVSIPSELGR